MIAPLAFVVGLSMVKEAMEDWRRFIQDMKVNSRKVCVHKGEGRFGYKPWQKLRVGDVVRVEKDQFFPADLLLLSSSYEDGICYVETMNLDGETNLKVKRSLEVTLPLDNVMAFKDFMATIRCEDPNPNLYTFVGNFEYEQQVYALDPNHILLRDSKLRNTTHVYGVVIFTGPDSKVMQNSTKSPSKRSGIERKMDKIIYVLFSILVLISVISSIGFAVKTRYFMPEMWYLQPQHTTDLYDPSNPGLSGIFHLITALILYGYLIPISLYVSIELVKVLQARFINQDIQMYDEESGVPAQARTSNLNEELGQVDTILSDKTGTLTCNQMDFLKCSIAGVSYGVRSSEVELAAARQMAMDLRGQNSENSNVPTPRSDNTNAWDNSVSELEGNITCKIDKAGAPMIKVCHAAIPEVDEVTGSFNYEAESPDEGAFLVAAREFGFEFCRRTQSSVFIQEKYPSTAHPVESIIFDRLSKNGRTFEEETRRHITEYGEAGLRTLAIAYKKLDQFEYSTWNTEFFKAKTTIGPDREALLERVSDMMEQDLILVGATAVEDKLQKGGMRQFCISTMNTDLLAQDPKKAVKENILMQITDASQTIKSEKDPHAAFALIIDGRTLTHALEDDMKHQFLNLAIECASVICCRVSPIQKALVTRLVKEGTGKTTLAIGDGANDVGMIQEADIGVGISGVEGMQAVMASDFSIAQFRFLERLLVVHGHWCYKRIAQMVCYFFYKNIAFGLTLFYFEAYTGFSGQSVYDDWYMLLFNVILTSLPVISLGVFEQDVSSEVCLQFPALYQQGPQNLFLTDLRHGFLGATMFTCIIWAVNCQIALTMSHFTWIQHLFVWGSITTWYIFLLLYGMSSSVMSSPVLIEALAPAPIYWAVTLLVTAACNLPYFVHISFQRLFNPMDHHVIQEIKYYKKDVEDQHMWTRECSKARQKTKIGFTARVEAKIRHLRGRLHKKYPSLSAASVPVAS
ncbi:putative phospholipid-transporting ATPase 5 [Acorus calamus]|uniref:Phospholipid-transporting ATPase n=1 Tax=Acorus calamus TaxID=4465 RepID=A0AAV9C0V8_ACOCL|nr:putative phospholipid-transporting ATPase 5 [Acorus calamus]